MSMQSVSNLPNKKLSGSQSPFRAAMQRAEAIESTTKWRVSTTSGAHGCSIAKVRLRPTLPHSRHQQPLSKTKGDKSSGAYHQLSVDHLFLYTYFGRAPFIWTRTDILTVLRSFNNYVHTFALRVTATLYEMAANVNPVPFRPNQPEHDFKHIPC
jgi:hypothetical protein